MVDSCYMEDPFYVRPHATTVAPLRSGRAIDANLAFAFALLVVATASGGFILGVGAFGNKVQNCGLLSASDSGIVFSGAFQIMTWMTVVWSLQLHLRGPRFCATLGLLISGVGSVLIYCAVSHSSHNAYLYLLGYGLMGGGGNGAFVSSFHFAGLFAAQGLRCTILSAGFSFCGGILMLLSIDSVTLEAFFGSVSVYRFCLAFLAAALYPDKPYSYGDRCVVTWPFRSASLQGPCRFNLFDHNMIRACYPALRGMRFWGFCITFSWSALILMWVQSSIFSIYTDAGPVFFEYGYPIVANATFVFGPAFGVLIDRHGFRLPALLVITSAQVLLASLLLNNSPGAWLTLVLINVTSACIYSMEFAYLTMTFPSIMYPGLLTITLISQGLFGLVAWPFLTVVRPFGTNWSYYIISLLVPTVFLYSWPIFLCKEYSQMDDHLSSTASIRSVIASDRYSHAGYSHAGSSFIAPMLAFSCNPSALTNEDDGHSSCHSLPRPEDIPDPRPVAKRTLKVNNTI